jgi:hypothetical protein
MVIVLAFKSYNFRAGLFFWFHCNEVQNEYRLFTNPPRIAYDRQLLALQGPVIACGESGPSQVEREHA